MTDTSAVLIQPEIRLRDGRIIRSHDDAIAYVRSHEARPGVDARDEVLHGLERARTDDERHAASAALLGWLRQLDLLHEPPGSAGTRSA
jgi:hypothetical protein